MKTFFPEPFSGYKNLSDDAYQYRILAILTVLLALALTLLIPYDQRRLRMPEPWTNELATRSFAQGKWNLSRDELAAARTQIRLQGGQLTQYIEISPDQWAFRQSPGHPLEMALFWNIGLPRLVNILLAILGAFIIYRLLACQYNERLAFLGVTLFLWSPISLLALHYYSMDTFAGGVWPLIAGATLLLYEIKSSQEPDKPYLSFMLFLVGAAAGWSVVVRVTNALLFGILTVYVLFLLWGQQRHQDSCTPLSGLRIVLFTRTVWLRLGAFILGIVVAFGLLAIYNHLTFGTFISSGYLYPSPYNQHNLWEENPVTSVPGGVSTWLAGGTLLDIIMTVFVHLRLWLRPATLAWPLWPVALFGLIKLLQQRPLTHATWLTLLWLAACYAPFAGIVFFGVTRALAAPYDQSWGFFIPARYLFPLTFPYIWSASFSFSRWSKKWSFVLMGLYVLGGAWLFVQVLSR